MKYFFYGTLMDDEVLNTVIGRKIPKGHCQSAILEGYQRLYRSGAWYPILVADRESRVAGLLVTGVTPGDAARLMSFEGIEYGLEELPVLSARNGVTLANVFLPRPGVPASSEVWTIDLWRRRHRKEYLRRTHTSSPRGSDWL